MQRISLPSQFNVATHFVDRHVHDGRGARVAIECGEERVTYQQLFERVNQVGNALKNLGVEREDRVALVLLDTPEFAYSFFGAIKIGAVPIPINTLLKPAEYLYILNDSQARLAIVSEALLPAIDGIGREQLLYLKQMLLAGTSTSRDGSLSAAMHGCSEELKAEPTSQDDPGFWLYSSGSTGFPKGCVHLHRDMVVCSELYAKATLSITESDRFFSVAKLFFAYGLGNGLYFPLSVGARSILWPGTPAAANIYKVIESYRPTLFFSVPSNFAALLAHHREGSADFDLSSIRYAVSAGEALPAAIYERFKKRFGVEILDAIGSTEALHMFIANRPGAVRPGSSGQVLPGYEARIVDENEHPVADGQIGNLLIKGDSVCSHYWNQPEKTRDTIHEGWLRTGDKYSRDPDGYYWYAGRSDDMLKVKGSWVSPIELESVLTQHSAVQEAAVVGRSNEEQLVRPAAYVVLRPGVNATPELVHELREFVAGKLAGFKRPEWVEFVTDLPKTATGKIQRYKLREKNGG